jgi:putative hemolysin
MLALEIAIVAFLTLVNGVLAMSEMAIVSSRRVRLQALAQQGSAGAKTAIRLLDDPSRFLSTVQIGITLVGIFAGAYGGATLAAPLGAVLDRIPAIAPNGDRVAIAVVVAVITYGSLVVGELVPKRLALANPERVATVVAGPMAALSQIAGPLVWLLRVSVDAILRLLGTKARRAQIVTEDEVRSLIAEGTRAGIFAPQERAMIDGVLRLADRSVRAVMTPRSEIVWIDIHADIAAFLEKIGTRRFTRLVVCDGGIDHPVGIVDLRELTIAAFCGEAFDLAKAKKPALFISEQVSVLRLLDFFRRESAHFAVIVDEYGATEGIVTVTAVLEAIAGDLPELGQDDVSPVVERDDGSLLVDGMMAIDDFAARIGVDTLRRGGDYETVAGFVVDQLGHIPRVGEKLDRPDMTVEIADMDGRRVDKLLVVRKHPPAAKG